MKVIVDTNIIFSSLLNQQSLLSDTLFREELNFIMPKYAYIELFKHKDKIIRFSRHNEDEILEILYRLLKNVDIFDETMIPPDTLKKAYELVQDVDEKDIIFVALTIELDGLLWTGDKKLIKALRKKGFDKFCELQGSELNRISVNTELLQ